MEKNQKNIKNNLYQNKIELLNNIINEPYIKYIKVNSFISFKSIYDILYLIYSTKKNAIIFYNLINNKKINEIKNAHQESITNFRHYLDSYNKRDLIISISLVDNNIKLWNIKNSELFT